jgi:hypothetical protein
VFLSRSGADKPEAAAVVEMVTSSGASARVFRADASNADEVQAMVNKVAATHPIRGVVHAAMVLQVRMSRRNEVVVILTYQI